MDPKCIAVCSQVCPKENITDENRCKIYDIGSSKYIKPYFQWADCPKKAIWEKVDNK